MVALVGWLGRSIILHVLSKDVEIYKENLRRETETLIKSHEHKLELAAHEYRQLFDRRGLVIVELYSKMLNLIGAAWSLVPVWAEPGTHEKRTIVSKAEYEF